MQLIWIMNVILMIFWTNDHNIEWIIWFFKKIVDHFWSKNSILVDFLGNGACHRLIRWVQVYGKFKKINKTPPMKTNYFRSHFETKVSSVLAATLPRTPLAMLLRIPRREHSRLLRLFIYCDIYYKIQYFSLSLH